MISYKRVHALAHAARLAIEDTQGQRSPFKFTADERKALVALGEAIDLPTSKIESDLARVESDEDFHQDFVRQMGEVDEESAELAGLAAE